MDQPVQYNYSDWSRMTHGCGEQLTWRIYHNGVQEIPQFYTQSYNGFCIKCPRCQVVLSWPSVIEQQTKW